MLAGIRSARASIAARRGAFLRLRLNCNSLSLAGRYSGHTIVPASFIWGSIKFIEAATRVYHSKRQPDTIRDVADRCLKAGHSIGARRSIGGTTARNLAY